MTASTTLSIAFSPCPNDTFIFHALLHGLVDCPTFDFALPRIEDVETLNTLAFNETFDLTKISFHALAYLRDSYVLLNAGAALGRGCGPLLVSKNTFALDDDLAGKTVAVPGRYTTAAGLLRMLAPKCQNIVHKRFDQIIPAVAAGEVDCGVVIHEGRFTYERYGLKLVCDLGLWWEKVSGHPIPLGGIVARRALGEGLIGKIERALAESVRLAFAYPQRSISYIKRYARELDEQVIGDHIALYVNSFSVDLGREGRAAVDAYFDYAKKTKALTI